MTKLALLISREEGFGCRDKIPTTHHNPGDLRHSPHSSHAGVGPDDIGRIPTNDLGWADLERQLKLYAQRGLTLRQAIEQFAPPSENNTSKYLQDVAHGLGVSPDTPMTEVLKIEV